MSEIKRKYFAFIATKYSHAYNYIFVSLHVSANVGHPQANTTLPYTLVVTYMYFSVLYSVLLRMTHVGRNM
jgi:hypothetical protein